MYIKFNNAITTKSLKVLQNILSIGKLNKLLLPLNDEFKKESQYDYFVIEDYFPFLYEETINLVIELAVLLRRESEQLSEYGISINNKVKYSNVGKHMDNYVDVSFSDVLSKIIHCDDIKLQSINGSKNVLYGYEADKHCEFTGNAMIKGTKQDGTPYQIIIDIKKICINAFMVSANEFTIQ